MLASQLIERYQTFCPPELAMEGDVSGLQIGTLNKEIKRVEKEMLEAAKNLEFEKAARLRDQLALLKEQAFGAVVHDHVVVKPDA